MYQRPLLRTAQLEPRRPHIRHGGPPRTHGQLDGRTTRQRGPGGGHHLEVVRDRLPARRHAEHGQPAVVGDPRHVAAGAAVQRQGDAALRGVSPSHRDPEQCVRPDEHRRARGHRHHCELRGGRGHGGGRRLGRRRWTRQGHRGAGRLAGRAAAHATHHVRIRPQVAQIRPVALGGSKREAVATHQVRHLTLSNDRVREQTDQVRLTQRLGPLGGEQHRQGEPQQTADRAFHGRAHLDCSNRRSTASTSE